MPKLLERKLRRTARKKHLSKKATNRYVYGTLRRTGWTPKRKKR